MDPKYRMFDIVAGIDVHRDTLVVCVRKRGEGRYDTTEIRTFNTFSDGLSAMVAWLSESEVQAVGIESTGVYWMPAVREIQRNIPLAVVWLVNPAEVKKVPGRKTDVSDAEWLSKLVMHGLVSPSYLPSAEQAELRVLTRLRRKLIADCTRIKNRITKELERMGFKLASVCSDVFGKSGRAMIDALIEGKESAEAIANLAQGVLRKKISELIRALQGNFSSSSKFVVRMLLRELDASRRDIAELDKEIAGRMQRLYPKELELLLTVPGINETSASAILAEIGGDMSVFPSADNLSSWSGLSPGSDTSAGKTRSSRTRKGDKYLRTMVVQAAWAAIRKNGSFLKQTFARLAHIGPKKAIVAVGRKIIVSIYYILRERMPYKEPEQRKLPPEKARRKAQYYAKQLAELGYDVSLTEKMAA